MQRNAYFYILHQVFPLLTLSSVMNRLLQTPVVPECALNLQNIENMGHIFKLDRFSYLTVQF